MPKPRLLDQSTAITVTQIIGGILLVISIIILIFLGIHIFWEQDEKKDYSALASVGFFLMLLGMAFYFPDMLKDETKGSISTMRVIIFMIVSVFVLLAVKAGWSAKSIKDLELDATWGYILLAALGSKAVQSLGESYVHAKYGKIPPNPTGPENQEPPVVFNPPPQHRPDNIR